MVNKFQHIVKEKNTEELLTMVYQFDQWDKKMLRAVEAELELRQQLPEDILVRKHELIKAEEEQLEKGKDATTLGLIIGWLSVLGLLGIIFGYGYSYSKTRSRYTGKRYFTYSEASRKHGSYILYTSIAVIIISVFYAVGVIVKM